MNIEKVIENLRIDYNQINDDQRYSLFNSYTRYRILRQAKLSNNEATNKYAQEFQNRLIEKIESNLKSVSFKEIKDSKKSVDLGAGVYLIYLKDKKNNVVLTYVGESKQIWTRWKSHLREIDPKTSQKRKRLYNKLKKLYKEQNLDYRKVRFVKIADEPDQNNRLISEAYFIYNFKSPVINANNKNLNSRAVCINGHGRMSSCLSYQILEFEVIPVVQFRCKNKECRVKFEIF
ncbi:GIY-YIG nuclease family protein [Spiroplasma endosymbiont of Panorpa germanica]|uniref:GIY-YIG nuclease family protein n=1 Tax=Spiroplasma endosymbiont of Panorpa germanica TaxID=3066314 RepID=UPI0030D131F0